MSESEWRELNRRSPSGGVSRSRMCLRVREPIPRFPPHISFRLGSSVMHILFCFFVRGVAFIGITAPLDNSLSCYEVCGSTILKEDKCGDTWVSVAPPAEGADNLALEDNSHPSRNLNPF